MKVHLKWLKLDKDCPNFQSNQQNCWKCTLQSHLVWNKLRECLYLTHMLEILSLAWGHVCCNGNTAQHFLIYCFFQELDRTIISQDIWTYAGIIVFCWNLAISQNSWRQYLGGTIYLQIYLEALLLQALTHSCIMHIVRQVSWI